MIKDPEVNAFYDEENKTLLVAVKIGQENAGIETVVVNDWETFQGRRFKADGEEFPIIKTFGA